MNKSENNNDQVLKADKKRNEVLTGNLWKVVLSVTLPIFLYQLVNVFYSLIDQVMVSSIGTNYVSAVAALTQIKQLISTLGGGIAAGGAILIAKYYGAFKYDKANIYATNTFFLAIILIGFIFLLMPFSNLILKIAQVPDDLIEISGVYFLLQLAEQILIIFNDLFLGMQKARCSTKPIFVTNIIAMVLKIIFNAVLIYGFKINNLAYIEVATIVSQLVIVIIGLYYSFDKRRNIYYALKKSSLSITVIRDILVVALPLFFGKFIISFGKVTVNAMCAFYSSMAIGALSISNSLTGLITNTVMSFEDSESSIVSLNLGNKNMKRGLKTFLVSCAYGCGWGIIGFILIRFVFLDEIVSLFALSKGNDSLEFMQAIKDIFYYDCLTIPALMINHLVLGFLYGYGETFISSINNIFRISIRIISLYIFQHFTNLGIEAIGISMAVSNVSIAVFALVMLAIFFIKVKIKGHQGMRFSDPEPEMVLVDGKMINKEFINN